MKLVYFTLSAAFALFAIAFALPTSGDLGPSALPKVQVKLKRLSNTNFQISVTNTGLEPLRIVKLDGLFSDLDVKKIAAIKEGNTLPVFGTTNVEIHAPALQDSTFQFLLPSATVDVQFDIARVYNLTGGGGVDLVSRGILLHATSGYSAVTRIPFTSNTLTVDINGLEAAGTREAQLAAPRNTNFVMQDDCNDSQSTNAHGLHDDSHETRFKVSDSFYKIGMECYNLHMGATKQYCNDQSNCLPGVQATTRATGTDLIISYCPNYFDAGYKVDNAKCHEDDQSLVMMHEVAHAMMFVDDVAYEYDNFVKLNSAENLNNADTYAFFAKAVHNRC